MSWLFFTISTLTDLSCAITLCNKLLKLQRMGTIVRYAVSMSVV